MPNIKIDLDAVLSAPGGAHILYFTCYNNVLAKKLEEMILFVLADTINVASLTVVDMYDPAATMERVIEEGVIATANVDAHFWRHLPRLESGRKTVRIIYDHHTLHNRFYFTDGTTSHRLRSAMPIFLDMLKKSGESWAIAFPDDGAAKRFGPQFKGFERIVCGKKRIEDKRIVSVMEGSPQDKRVIIVDDLIRSGGTILECAGKLVEMGAKEMNAFVVHAEFPNDSWKKFLPENCQKVKFGTFWVSDSVQETVKKIANTAPFKVVSLVEDLTSVFDSL